MIKPGDKSGLNSDVFLIAPHRAQALEQFYLNKFGKKSNKQWNFFYRNDAILSKEWDPRYLTLWIPPQSKERIISQSNLNFKWKKTFPHNHHLRGAYSNLRPNSLHGYVRYFGQHWAWQIRDNYLALYHELCRRLERLWRLKMNWCGLFKGLRVSRNAPQSRCTGSGTRIESARFYDCSPGQKSVTSRKGRD